MFCSRCQLPHMHRMICFQKPYHQAHRCRRGRKKKTKTGEATSHLDAFYVCICVCCCDIHCEFRYCYISYCTVLFVTSVRSLLRFQNNTFLLFFYFCCCCPVTESERGRKKIGNSAFNLVDAEHKKGKYIFCVGIFRKNPRNVI